MALPGTDPLREEQTELGQGSEQTWEEASDSGSDSTDTSSQSDTQKNITVGILGGGAAGLYAAMIIDSFEDSSISWTMYEADKSRLGGRLYTHNFSDSENDYYVSLPQTTA